jgi:hypothetical protein
MTTSDKSCKDSNPIPPLGIPKDAEREIIANYGQGH